jgi:hypothetical protein
LSFQDLVLTFDTGPVAPAGTLVIVMGDNSAAGRSHFDNVRLDATIIPEPGVFAIMGMALAGIFRRRR